MSDSITTKNGATFSINSEQIRGEGRYYWIERRERGAPTVRDDTFDGTYNRATAKRRLRRAVEAWALVKALWTLSAPVSGSTTTSEGDWCYADTLVRHAAHNYGVEMTPIAAGRLLSALAREGKVAARFDGAFNRYKHPEWVRGWRDAPEGS